ncbi:RNA demethylase ALKBH9B-like [Lolium rigidum]|uniref:RNA demethylase ALKBH9B-like n=1 Tax=Lolium rigidum TaxID=89674 RepID=UPI001F5E0596|nr:RNA demethylase ALKBH9B-like [Lolium rigidum]
MSSSSPLLSDEGVSRVRRKKDFSHMDRVDGRPVNILQGLELHTAVFSPEEQRAIVAAVLDLQDRGRRGLLRERTYSEPRKWMRGKGRATIQFGCCYNYAVDRDGNPPGIVRESAVDPLPPLLAAMVRRLVLWRVLPRACVPDSCIVNIYDVDDCIPPHVDSHDFLRPFCTASFLADCDILFGRSLKVLGPGEFGGAGSTAINLPAGSVLVLNGNGADVAKHCVPAVPAKRISITFRKMDAAKVPFGFTPHAMLQNLSAAAPPAVLRPGMTSTSTPPQPPQNTGAAEGQSPGGVPFSLSTDEFPSLGASSPAVRPAMTSTPLYRPHNTGAADQETQSAAARAATPKPQQAATPHNKNRVAPVTARQSAGGVPFGLSTDEFPALGALPASGRRPGRR